MRILTLICVIVSCLSLGRVVKLEHEIDYLKMVVIDMGVEEIKDFKSINIRSAGMSIEEELINYGE